MPKHIYNPHRWQAQDFFQALSKKRSMIEAAQQEAMRQRVVAQQQTNLRNLQFPSAGAVAAASPVAVDPHIRAKIREQQLKIAKHLAKK
ncbi:hypothetical protein BVRB_029840 [Beta vulgaris subsp. vulgaris]|uniref:Uncharacterized protein n=1 Tax=Beta vulgaris subsp. vulgaris TaxID=3555 RepID=A0A0J8DS95_BETVV|nr:hypothetical protein BVRB_029840 [Beta vulgaris subsp. vulgaris]